MKENIPARGHRHDKTQTRETGHARRTVGRGLAAVPDRVVVSIP